MTAEAVRNVLVFDAGSSALKAVVFDAAGTVVARAEVPYARPVVNNRQSPWDWWGAAVVAARQLHAPPIGAISLTGTMENLIPISVHGEPLGDALLYSDPCGAPLLAEIKAELDEANAAKVCGNVPEPLMTAFKLAWLRRHEAERFERAACFLPGSKDFLALRLTGELVTDPTCAATTGLMDIAARDWSNPLRAVFGIERRRLPHIRPAADVIGHLIPAAADELGLEPGLPVINGCGDGGATTVGGGADNASDVSLYLGTTGWVARVAGSATLASAGSFYRLPHPVGEGVIEIAPILSAGGAAAWARGTLGLALEESEAAARTTDDAPGELIFLPYLNGERSPFLDLEVRGAFIGLATSHGAPQLYYAVLEGVALAVAANLTAMGGAGRKVSLIGGGARSGIWPQLMADILDTPILTPADPGAATALGAFRIAQRALRLPPSQSVLATAAMPRLDRLERASRLRSRFAEATAMVRRLH